jgi:hypothetical protein
MGKPVDPRVFKQHPWSFHLRVHISAPYIPYYIFIGFPYPTTLIVPWWILLQGVHIPVGYRDIIYSSQCWHRSQGLVLEVVEIGTYNEGRVNQRRIK